MKKLFLFFLLSVMLTGTRAQSNDSTYHFTMQQAIEYALQNHKDPLNAELDAQITQQQVKEFRSYGLPQLNGSVDVKDFEKIPVQFIPDFITPTVYNVLFDENVIPRKDLGAPETFPVQFGTQWNATAGVTASQLLFDPVYLVGLKGIKTINELSVKNTHRVRIETAVEVSKAYYQVLIIDKRRESVDANVIRLKKLLDDTKALYDNGFVEKLDVDFVQILYNNMLTEQDKFVRLLKFTSDLLKFQIGMPISNTIITTDTLNATELMNTSILIPKPDPSKRIEYSILKTQEQLGEYNLKRYKVGYYPSLSAYASLSTTAQRETFDFQNNAKWYPTGVIGATLNVPIFDGLRKSAKIRGERLALRKTQNDLINFEQTVNVEVENNLNLLQYSVSTLVVQEKNLRLAEDIYSRSKIKYDQGVGSNLEVITAETALKEAQANYYNSMYEVVVAKLNLDKAQGNIIY